jgi:predicted nucleic acid-binding protein
MILPTSTVWIDYFNGNNTPQTEVLARLLGSDLYVVVMGDLILTQLLKGFRSEPDFQYASELLLDLQVEKMLGQEIAKQSAQNYRLLRQQGISIHKTTDLIISTFCIVNALTLLDAGDDFLPMIKHLDLQVLSCNETLETLT